MRKLKQLRHAPYQSITEQEWRHLRRCGVTNGFGPSGDRILHAVIRRMAPMFRESSADIHDFTYWQGGTESDRKNDDLWFFKRLMRDARATGGIRFAYYTILAISFYFAVRARGGRYFHYTGACE